MSGRKPALKPGDVTVTLDQHGREVIVIPDGVAAAISAEVHDGWTECKGMMYGESRRFEPGTWMYDTTVTLLNAFAASAAPTGLDDQGTWMVNRDREEAARGTTLHALIVGVSGWDTTDKTWKDHEETWYLRVHGRIHLRGTDYRYEG